MSASPVNNQRSPTWFTWTGLEASSIYFLKYVFLGYFLCIFFFLIFIYGRILLSSFFNFEDITIEGSS
jgi:hypothetical protein